MRHIQAIARRIMGVFGRARRDRELAEELESHIAFDAEDRVFRGVDPVEARRQAVLNSGGVERTKESYRERRGVPFVETALQDLRYAGRVFRRSPGFTMVAVVTLALGIGGNTAVFSIVDVVWLKSLPVTNPERLVYVSVVSRTGERHNASYPMFRRLRDNEPTLIGVYATLDGTYRLPVAGHRRNDAPSDGHVQLVSGEYFAVLGVSAFGGRVLTPNDNRVPGGHAVAVVSHEFWRRRLHGDPAVIGASIRIKDQAFTVTGIAPPGFFGDAVGQAPDVWVPIAMQPVLDGPASLLESNNTGWVRIVGRLRDGVTAQHARESIPRTLARLNDRTRLGVLDATRGIPLFHDRFTPALRILAGVVAVVLLLACTNIATLLLARAEVRQRETAIRLAIGAGYGRLMRQFLTEGAVLAAAGGALGVLVAWSTARTLLVLLSTDGTPVPIDVSPNARVLGFAIGVSCLTVLIFALGPAVLALRGLTSGLKGGPAKRRALRPGHGLIGVQVALSVLVVNVAALFVRTLQNLRDYDLGFAHETLVQLEVDPEASGLVPAQVPDVSRRIIDRLSRLPGVEAVTASHSGFATGTSRTCCIAVEGHAHYRGEEREVATLGVMPGYLSAVALPLRHGRDFLPHESTTDPRQMPRVAIANEEFVRRYVETGSPLGRRVGWGDDPQKAAYTFEIIGVASNAIYDDLRQATRPLLYFPSVAGTLFTIRLAAPNESALAALRREVRAMDAKLEITTLSIVARDVERTLVRERMLATLSTVLGAAVVLLAAIGVYGLAAHTVAARKREIGVRMALGASRRRVRVSELWSAIRLAAVGVTAGIPLALATGRFVRAEMFGISTSDPLTLSATSALLIVLAAVASLVPAHRASSVDPMIALRSD